MKIKFNNNSKIIFIVSIIYGLIIHSGYIGFGIDYVAAYQKPNFVASNVNNFLGWSLSTLNLYDIQVGSFLVAFLISLGSGSLLNYFFSLQNINSRSLFIFIFTISLFSWPLIISSNNAMRQGVMMSFIYFGLFFTVKKNYYLGILFFILSVFTHRSGIAYFITFIYSLLVELYENLNFKKKKINILILGTIFFFGTLFAFLFIPSHYGTYETNKPIGIDFTSLNFLINVLIVYLIILNKEIFKNFIYKYLFFFCFSSLSVFYAGNFWEYERYNMVMMILYIYAFSIFIKNNSKYFYFIFVLLFLFLLTVLTGMYETGVGIFYRNQL